jgi:dihydrodipicolinate reductase
LYFETEKSSTTKLGDAILVKEKTTNLYHGEAIGLFKQKQNIERSLYLYKDPFDLIFDFSTPQISAGETKELSYKFVKLFLFFGFFLVLFIDQRKFFIQVIKDAKQK